MSDEPKTATAVMMMHRNAVLTAEHYLHVWARMNGFYEHPNVMVMPPEAVIAFTDEYTRYLWDAVQHFERGWRETLARTPMPPIVQP